MVKKTNNLTFKIVLVLLAGTVVLSLFAFCLEPILSEKHSNKTNCSDFGTQEKAQHAFDKDRGNLVVYRLIGLDSDNDGRACEENPKSAPITILIAFIGIFGALVFAEWKRIGSLKDTDFLRKFVLPSLVLVYPISFSVSQLRDRVLPSSTQAFVIYVLAFLVAYVPTYFYSQRVWSAWCD
jgi:hypothetical protein